MIRAGHFFVLQRIDIWNDFRPGDMFSMLVYNYIYTPKNISKPKK